ncbi:MAG: hypothetical protein JXR77_12700 [Lentisphaeria bacterium]|nr:hypothetical protein [Lentisphaeria bacterium]
MTRSLTAQVAAKVGADTRFFTLHLAQDRQAGGGWGTAYGHIMFTDPMLEENVQRTAPKP